MNVKQFLRQIRRIDGVIQAKLEQVEQLRSLAEKVTSVPPSPDGIRKHGGQDKLGNTIARIVDLENEINTSTNDLIKTKKQARKIIKAIPDVRYQTILIEYYFNRKTWEQIAVDMDYTYQWVCILHGRALQEFEKISKKY